MMCSAYRLNKQGDNRQSCCTLFSNLEPISCSDCSNCSNCCFLTCIQISQETGKMVWYSHLSESCPQFVMIHTVKAFSRDDKRDRYLSEMPLFPCNPVNVGDLTSRSSYISKPSLDIWNFLVHIMLKSRMQDFKHEPTSMGDECNCLMASTFFATTLLGTEMRTDLFQSCGHCWVFQI